MREIKKKLEDLREGKAAGKVMLLTVKACDCICHYPSICNSQKAIYKKHIKIHLCTQHI